MKIIGEKLHLNLCKGCIEDLQEYNPYVFENGDAIELENIEVTEVSIEKCHNKAIVNDSAKDNPLAEIGEMQDAYASLYRSGKMTKAAICELVIPFRDKYALLDGQALSIARGELSISQINKLVNTKTKK